MSSLSGQQLMSLHYETVPNKEDSPLESLRTVDWDFPERVTHSKIEGIHPYPAKFIAEIPRSLINALPFQNGTAVLDLFCGSGTTLVECQREGIPSIGIDLNPIACLISRVKTSECPINLKAEACRVVERAKELSSPKVPPIPNLDHWFKRGIQEELASFTEAIARAPAQSRDCLQLALSSIIVRISNQESDTRYAAITKDIERKDVAILFRRAIERILTALHARRYDLTKSQVLEGNTLQLAPEQIRRPISLVVTSPPYPNAYEYWLYHKYRMWWLGFDPLRVKAKEIGARAHFFKKNHQTAEDFRRQMRQTLALLNRVVVRGGYVCFVVGRSRIHGQIVDNAQIVEEAGSEYGFHRYFITRRALPPSRKSFNLSHANIKTETVLVMRKGGS